MEESFNKEALLMAFAEDPEEFSPYGYEIICELGRGGMAVIYQARQLKPERDVALKVMLPKYAGDEMMRKRFQLEVKAMAVLENTHILPIYEVSEWNGMPFFSMKLAEKGCLASILHTRDPSIKQIVSWMRDVSEAIDFAHQRGVLHRDLKPANLLFDKEDNIYVGDFGVAKLTLDTVEFGLTHTESMIGTPHYMAPEVMSEEVSVVSIAGDIYSLGAVFYECLSRQKPFSNTTNIASLARAILEKNPTDLRSIRPDLPLDIEIICQKAMAKKPEDRYSSMKSFYHDLTLWELGEPIKARKLSSYEFVIRWCKARPVITALLGILLIMAIAWAVTISQASYRQRLALHEANLALATSERSVGEPGFRQRALALLKKSANLANTPAIKNEVIAILSQEDLVENQETDAEIGTPNGGQNQGYLLEYNSELDTVTLSQSFSPQMLRTWKSNPDKVLRGEFISDSILLIVGSERGDFLYTGEGFSQETELSLRGNPLFVSSDRTGDKVAFTYSDGISILDVGEGKIIRFLDVGVSRCKPEWSEDSSLLAVSHGDVKGVYLYQTANWSLYQIYRTTGFPLKMRFQPNGILFGVLADDMQITLLNLRTHSPFARLAVKPSNKASLDFSSDGRELLIGGEYPQSWSILPPQAFKHWSGFQLSYGLVRNFSASLSPEEQFFITVSSEGIHLWNISQQTLSDFYSVENQRIDSRTDAWWLDETSILVQIPGGLEIISVSEDGKLSLDRVIKGRPPGSRVIHILEGNQWLMEVRRPQKKRSLVIYPNGDFTKEKQLGDKKRPTMNPSVKTHENGITAKLLENGMIQVSGRQSFLLPPPKGVAIQQIEWMKSGRRLLGISSGGHVYEWDLANLEDLILKFGF